MRSSFPDFDIFTPDLQHAALEHSRFLCKTGKEPGTVIVEELRRPAHCHGNNTRLKGTESRKMGLDGRTTL